MEPAGAGALPLIPFREFVVKVHSRCDLACDHCYIYEHADQSWRRRPAVVSDAVAERIAQRLAEHAATHGLPSVTVILLGGEPLLAGPARLRTLCEALTRALDGVSALDLRIHTNGLRLNTAFLDLFREYGVKVGVSLDGDRAANDRHRRFANGRTSHPGVLKALGLLRQDRYRHLYQGLLCTVDVENDPRAVFDALTALEPPRIDFLLPHATWETPPARPDGRPDAYARWLLRVFDRWEARGRPVPVRMFDSLLSTLRGGPSLTESLGLAPTDLVVVETDGTLEQADSLKTAHEGAAATGFDVFTHTFDEVAAHPGIRARQSGLAGVSAACRRCPVVRSCGGGLYAHRYRAANGFDNPSVYCTDLRELVDGVEVRTARAAVAPESADPAALSASQQELTRVLLARLHADLADLAGSGGEGWQRSWELITALEAEAPDALDAVLDHPYTRTWLIRALHAVRRGRRPDEPVAFRLSALAAAAAVRGRLEATVSVVHRGGELYLPTLGLLRTGRTEVGIRAAGEGFRVREGSTERRFGRSEEDPGWLPVRVWPGAGADAPPMALDDLDPYRDCFSRTPRTRLDGAEAGDWQRRLGAAWALLHRTVPGLARETAAGLGTLTPLTGPGSGSGSVKAGQCGPGALGVPYAADVRRTALALLTGRRRAGLRELTEVADLYALDGEWLHESPWRERPVPVSELLADAYARVAAEEYRRSEGPVGGAGPGDGPGDGDAIKRALDRLSGAAELTVSGKAVVARLRREFESGA
ncbi:MULTISPECIES: radical SAM/SPASM protein FxsBH, inactivated beta-hydroxylase extension form [unclassified Streptomyces]|uniref:radical SAM/SPASM protein FxsBH, inactivated beta-hydroxylase extension form n=1 Tax=unclassified Streptomyces TaxID=2593676 RepID=UPI002259A23A|nr:radical SAM/SPASM protein FxsB, inactivated metallohydrolase extension form [Streptomyces sp. NBC_00047]MCX5608778.1 radical SAM/SPASM protein FxsB, inactivated metallohydrolase extension form [Streptomyces sp. NBC_00047]